MVFTVHHIKLINVFTLFYAIYTAVIFPVMNKFFKNDENLLTVILEKSIKYLMMLMIPLAFAVTFYSIDIVVLIFGKQYADASTVLSILIWTVCLLFINGTCTNLLNASHREKSVTIIYLIAAIFNISVNSYLIPHYSYNGAAVATVLSDLLIVVLSFIIISRIGKLPSKKLIIDLVKIIIGSVVLYYALTILNISMWLAIPIGIIIYFALIIALRTFDGADKYIIKEILGKN